MTYSEKLKHPKWQRLRLEVLNRDDFTCRHCGDKESPLHIHHARYVKGAPWETPVAYLVTLCANCHGVVEGIIAAARFKLSTSEPMRHMVVAMLYWMDYPSKESERLVCLLDEVASIGGGRWKQEYGGGDDD